MNVSDKQFEEAVGRSLLTYRHQCHAASLALVKSGLLGVSRVARGTCRGVGGQHSWVVLGDDCYDPRATIVDPTLWSYDDSVTGIWTGKPSARPHLPHGWGSIWNAGYPLPPQDEPIELAVKLGREAQMFMDLIGPLDRRGWMTLVNLPVGGWPAAEVIAAICDTPELGESLVPVDRIGMLTDRNPNGLYR